MKMRLKAAAALTTVALLPTTAAVVAAAPSDAAPASHASVQRVQPAIPARRTIRVSQVGRHPNFVVARVVVSPRDRAGVVAQMMRHGHWVRVKKLRPSGGTVTFRGLGAVRVVAKADGTYKRAIWNSRISKG